MTEIKTNLNNVGQIQIADEVISIIAGTAAQEVDGVFGAVGNFTGDLVEILGKKNFSKGVKIVVDENKVTVDLTLIVKFGFKIPEVAAGVQKKVKDAIETMTGLSVTETNVSIAGVQMEKEIKPVREKPVRKETKHEPQK